MVELNILKARGAKFSTFYASIAFVYHLLDSKTITSSLLYQTSPFKHKRRRTNTTFRLNCKGIEREKPSWERIPISKLILYSG